MKSVEIVRYKNRLDSLFGRINSLAGDIEMQAQWAQYLCIITSGFIESSIRILFIEYARVKICSSHSQLRKSRNTIFSKCKIRKDNRTYSHIQPTVGS